MRLFALAFIFLTHMPFASAFDAQTDVERWHQLDSLVEEAAKTEQSEEGIELAGEAYRFALQAFGETHPHTSKSRLDLAEFYSSIQRDDEAIALYELDLQLTRDGLSRNDLYNKLHNLGALYRLHDLHEKAVPLYRELVQVQREAQGPIRDVELRMALRMLATSALNGGQYHDAEKAYKEAIDLTSRESEEVPYLLLDGLVFALKKQGRYDEAIPVIEGVRAGIERETPPNVAGLDILIQLGSLYEKKKNYDDAEEVYRRVLEMSQGTSDHHRDSLIRLFLMYEKQGQSKEAARTMKELLDFYDEKDVREIIERARLF